MLIVLTSKHFSYYIFSLQGENFLFICVWPSSYCLCIKPRHQPTIFLDDRNGRNSRRQFSVTMALKGSSSRKDGSRQNNRNNQKKRTMSVSKDEIVAALDERISEETPARGSAPAGIAAFASLPLSEPTLRGLAECEYDTMTQIQAAAIPHALAGRDILGAAKTGSGKSLAFLVPLLEKLYRSPPQDWIPQDGGVGAIVLSPTRELAGQLFAVLQRIGRHHREYSVGLLMGGRKQHTGPSGGGGGGKKNGNHNHNPVDAQFLREQQALPSTNILICTPGRLLQHLEQTPYFNCDNLQMLVLDEADRILDLGFRDQLLKILDYLPQQRQTLLFSATQTKDVKHLATLSMHHSTVEYVGVHDNDQERTPTQLQQAYVVVPLPHKLDCLYSFLKSHLKCKTICFFATCSQVRHAWDLLCRLRPGLSVLALHGKLSQEKRLQVYDKFTQTPHVVLLATDVASRGLDFPAVDWVVQVDAPEDYNVYIHRVGRTARGVASSKKKKAVSGQSLLLLDPLEEACFVGKPGRDEKENNFIKKKLKVPLKKKSINPTKTMLVSKRASSLVAEHNNMYTLAKKAFWSYVRSLSLLPRDDGKNKNTAAIGWQHLDVRKMQLEAYAHALGLPNIPGDLDKVLGNISSRDSLRETKNVNRKLQKLKEQIKAEKEEKKRKRQLEKDGGTEDSDASKKSKRDIGASNTEREDEEDDFLVVKARHEATSMDDELDISTTRRHPKKIRIDGGMADPKQHTIFEDDGTVQPKLLQPASDCSAESNIENKSLQGASESYLDHVRERLERTREIDKEEERERIRAKHRKKRLQEKLDLGDGVDNVKGGNEMVAVLDSNTPFQGTVDSSSSSDGDGDDNSSSSGGGGSSDDEDDDRDADISMEMAQQREALALSLIRQTTGI
jgi:ATP-dependent RNA helicase DDX10/DBP4